MPRLSFTGKRWKLTPQVVHGDLVNGITSERGLSSSTKGVGIDAAVFPDIGKAVDRIDRAVKDGEKIMLFGDYDCDGVTSTAILIRHLERRGVRPLVRLPHRIREGYGLKPQHIEECASRGATLLITLDTGISSKKEIEDAVRRGIDVIVIDHHHVPDELPPAYALIHPVTAKGKIAAPPAAAGVAWSVVRELERSLGNDTWPDMETDVALAAIGTIADLVELKGENRTLVTEGLRALNSMENGALGLLKLQSGMPGQATCRDVAFRLAPRLNAAGRMADPMIALRALLGHHESLLELERLNEERQMTVAGFFDEALTSVDSSQLFLTLAKTEYTPGIVGLIAGKLTEKFGKPSLVAAIQDDLCMASLRSIPEYHVTNGLTKTKGHLISFGGHAQAAGCTFHRQSLPILQELLSEDVRATVDTEALFPFLAVDRELSADQITLALCEELKTLEPFGQGNPEPRFVIPSVVLQDARRVGKESNHLQAKLGGAKLIGFGLGGLEDMIRQPVDIVVRLSVDTWNGVTRPQLMLVDAGTGMLQQETTKEPSGTALSSMQ